MVQLNVIMDVLGGWSQDLEAEMKKIFGLRSLDILKRMQKAVLSGAYVQSHHKVNSEISIQDNRHLHKRER